MRLDKTMVLLQQSLLSHEERIYFVAQLLALREVLRNKDGYYRTPISFEEYMRGKKAVPYEFFFRDLERDNPVLEGLFSIHYAHINDKVLWQAVEELYGAVSRTMDRFNYDAHDAIQQLLASGREQQTPQAVIDLLLHILLFDRGSFLDGLARTGALLFEAYKWSIVWGGRQTRFKALAAFQRAAAIVRLQAVIHRIAPEKVNVKEYSTRDLLAHWDNEQFDSIVFDQSIPLSSMLPRNLMLNEMNLQTGTKSKVSMDWFVLTNALRLLKPDGTGAFILPLPHLARNIDEQYRRRLVEEDLIESIIQLPSNLYHGRSLSVAILVVRKNKKPEMQGKIQMINAERGYESDRTIRRLRQEDKEKILRAYREKTGEETFSKIVSREEIANMEYVLNPSSYFDQTQEVESNLGRVRVNLRAFADRETTCALKDVATIYRGANMPTKQKEGAGPKVKVISLKDVADGEINFGDLTEARITNPMKYIVQPGDLIISGKGTTRKIAIVPYDYNGEDVVLSEMFFGIRLDPNQMNPYFLKLFLESPIGQAHFDEVLKTKGTTLPNMTLKEIQEIPVPVIPLRQQLGIIQADGHARAEYEQRIAEAKRRMEVASEEIYEQMGIMSALQRI